MRVVLIACTRITDHVSETSYLPQGNADCDELAEFAGRACYQSWDRPNPSTANNAGYLSNILEHSHFSVLEHASATFYITGVSRALSHELVRHRHLSFSQMSQRFVDETDAQVILPPALDENAWIAESLTRHAHRSQQLYKLFVKGLIQSGLSRKQAREAARAALPSATETRLVVTGNMRAWREVISKRGSPHADAEIQLLARELLLQLKNLAPHTFQDMDM